MTFETRWKFAKLQRSVMGWIYRNPDEIFMFGIALAVMMLWGFIVYVGTLQAIGGK